MYHSALLLNVGHDGAMAVCRGGELISPIQRLWHDHFVMAGHDACNVRGAKCGFWQKWETFTQKWVELTQLFSWYYPSPKVVWNPKAVKYLFSHPAVCMITPMLCLLSLSSSMCILWRHWHHLLLAATHILATYPSLHYWFLSVFLSLFSSIFWPASPVTHLLLVQLILLRLSLALVLHLTAFSPLVV